MNKLLHYTKIDKAYSIINSNIIRFGNIRFCNDFREAENFIGPDDGSMFIFSCSMSPLNSTNWLAYAGDKYGVAIEFVFNEDAHYLDLFNNSVRGVPIKYVSDLWDYIADHINENGLVKDNFFKLENEYRFYDYISTSNDDAFIEYKLNLKCLKQINIYVHKTMLNYAATLFKEFKFVNIIANRFIR